MIDGCSVLPYERNTFMPSLVTRSVTATGTVEPPSPAKGISARCSAVKSGWSSRLVRK